MDFVYEDIGATYCSGQPNSTGLPAVTLAAGSAAVSDQNLTLIALNLPPGQFAHFFTSQTQGSVFVIGTQGELCVVGNIARFNNQIFQGPTGAISVDMQAIPANPTTAILAGEQWNFQCWYRDVNPGTTSNFTSATAVTFF